MRKRRPDLMTILATLVALGVLATGLVQGAMRDAQVPPAATASR